MTRKIKIVQFGFEVSGSGEWESTTHISSELWALGEDGKLYAWEYQGVKGSKWVERFKGIEVEDGRNKSHRLDREAQRLRRKSLALPGATTLMAIYCELEKVLRL